MYVFSIDICDVVFGSSQVNVHKEIAVFQSHRVVKRKKKIIRQLLKSKACVKCEMYVKDIYECDNVNNSVAWLLV